MEHDWEKVFGSRIREMRRLRGWTQEDIAQRMSDAGHPMHQTTVAKLESGTRPTSVAEVGALAALLEVPIASLFGSSDRLSEQMELNALAYRIKGLAAESLRLTDELQSVMERRAAIAAELNEVTETYERIKQSFDAKNSDEDKGDK